MVMFDHVWHFFPVFGTLCVQVLTMTIMLCRTSSLYVSLEASAVPVLQGRQWGLLSFLSHKKAKNQS